MYRKLNENCNKQKTRYTKSVQQWRTCEMKLKEISWTNSEMFWNRAGGRTPRTSRSGGGPHACSGASCCVGEPFWAQQNAKNLLVAGAPPRTPLGELTALPRPHSWWGGAPRGALLPPPQEPHLQFCHCACLMCMYTRVWKCTVIFSWMLNTANICILNAPLTLTCILGGRPPTI